MRRKVLIALIGIGTVGAVFLFPYPRFVIHRVGMKLSRVVGNPKVDLEPARIRLDRILGPNANLPLADAHLHVDKSERVMKLYAGDRLVKEYRIALGGTPLGGKKRLGDGCTPIGGYRIASRMRSQYRLFLGLNYPNAKDATKALQAGVISRSDFDILSKAESDKSMPSWETPLGGAIGIHGGGSQYDWTLGCIALDNADIDEIWLAVTDWALVVIED